MMLLLLALWAVAPAVAAAPASAQTPDPRPEAAPRIANPVGLRASQQLARQAPGEAARVLFEWDQVRGARAYVLQGSWVDRGTWALQTREYRVAPANARAWTAELVSFDVSLPPGSHSWTVVAVFGETNLGDFAHPTHVAFDLGGSGD